MSKNLHKTRNANIGVYGAVPAGTVSGDVLPLGSGGLIGWALTDRVTQAELDDFSNNSVIPSQGLKDGEASLELIGVATSVKLEVSAAVTLWATVYVTPGGAYTPTAMGNTQVGFALAAATAAGQTIPVGLK